MSGPQNFTLFLASPADTADARKLVYEVIAEINADPLYQRQATFELLAWDDKTRPVPCSFLRNPQHEVVKYTGDPAACDLVVALFRHEFGSPLPVEDFGLNGDNQPWTGTEWELHRGIEAARQGQLREVLVFRDTTTFEIPADVDANESERRFQQAQRVKRFFEACRRPGTKEILRGINDHHGPADFKAKFAGHLKAWLAQQIPPVADALPASSAIVPVAETLTTAQQALRDTLLRFDDPTDRELLTAAWDTPVQGLQGYLLSRFAAWSRPGHGELDTRFVNLDLLVDRGVKSEGERYETRQRYASLQAMLTDNPGTGAWVLVGDPGGGKSTLLQQLELDTARATLRALANGEARPELCIWQRLADCPHDTRDIQAWLEAAWHERFPKLPSLAALAERFRLRYLLDGVNEIQAPDAQAYRAAVRRWADWAAGLARSGGARHAPPLFSVRTLEYSEPLSSEGLEVKQARLALWSNEQMRAYL